MSDDQDRDGHDLERVIRRALADARADMTDADGRTAAIMVRRRS
jgi:hypothetical protein